MIDSSHDFILDVKIDSQVIQAVTFLIPDRWRSLFTISKGHLTITKTGHKELPGRLVVSNIFYFHPEPWGNDPI